MPVARAPSQAHWHQTVPAPGVRPGTSRQRAAPASGCGPARTPRRGPACDKYRAFRARPARWWRPGPSESGGTERHKSHTTRNVELIVSSEALVLSFGYRPRPLAPHASAGESRSAAAPRLNSFKLRRRHSGSGPGRGSISGSIGRLAMPGPGQRVTRQPVEGDSLVTAIIRVMPSLRLQMKCVSHESLK